MLFWHQSCSLYHMTKHLKLVHDSKIIPPAFMIRMCKSFIISCCLYPVALSVSLSLSLSFPFQLEQLWNVTCKFNQEDDILVFAFAYWHYMHLLSLFPLLSPFPWPWTLELASTMLCFSSLQLEPGTMDFVFLSFSAHYVQFHSACLFSVFLFVYK